MKYPMNKILNFISRVFTTIGLCVTILWLAALFDVGNFAMYYGNAKQVYIDMESKTIKEYK